MLVGCIFAVLSTQTKIPLNKAALGYPGPFKIEEIKPNAWPGIFLKISLSHFIKSDKKTTLATDKPIPLS